MIKAIKLKQMCVCAVFFPCLTQIRCHADSGRSSLFSTDGPWLSCYDTLQRPSEGPSNYHRGTRTTKKQSTSNLWKGPLEAIHKSV